MITIERKKLEQVLEALTYCEALNKDVEQQKMQAITAIKETLAQPEQEPVFLIYDDAGGWIESNESEYRKTEEVNRWLLYTTPPKREWVGLTEDELVQIGVATGLERAAAQMIESKLKEKNT